MKNNNGESMLNIIFGLLLIIFETIYLAYSKTHSLAGLAFILLILGCFIFGKGFYDLLEDKR
jgi:hypothetical protein